MVKISGRKKDVLILLKRDVLILKRDVLILKISGRKKEILMKTFQPVEYKGNELVVQNNSLINSPRNLNLQEQKLFLFLISKINPLDFDQNLKFRISVREFASAIGTNRTNNSYRDVRNLVQTLQQKVITLHRTETNIETITDITLITYAKYWPTLGYADIEINSNLLPFLSELHEQFTRYKLSNITKLSSLYAIRLYELLKIQENLGKRIFFIDNLRKKLKLTDNSLPSFKDFRRRVLEIAKREINSKTDLTIDYIFHKEGRKIVAVEFNIESKSKSNLLSVSKELQKKQATIAKELLKYGFSISETLDINKLYHPNRIECALKAVTQYIKQNSNVDIKAVVTRAIEEQWYPKYNQVRSQSRKPLQSQSKKKKLFFSKIFNLFK